MLRKNLRMGAADELGGVLHRSSGRQQHHAWITLDRHDRVAQSRLAPEAVLDPDCRDESEAPVQPGHAQVEVHQQHGRVRVRRGGDGKVDGREGLALVGARAQHRDRVPALLAHALQHPRAQQAKAVGGVANHAGQQQARFLKRAVADSDRAADVNLLTVRRCRRNRHRLDRLRTRCGLAQYGTRRDLRRGLAFLPRKLHGPLDALYHAIDLMPRPLQRPGASGARRRIVSASLARSPRE
jgi:hypothetical protein